MAAPGRPLVLASASRVRAEMLAAAGLSVLVRPAGIDEAATKAAYRAAGGDATALAAALAERKAEMVAARHRGALVIGADQVLDCDGEWFDKPADREGARAQLIALRGRAHRLATAACVVHDGRRLWRHISVPRLTMRDFGRAFLDAYLDQAGAAARTSVGAYQIEGPGAQLFRRIEGDHFAVLGLPLLPLLAFLRRAGVLRT